MGYAWTPKVRTTPLNGIAETIDLTSAGFLISGDVTTVNVQNDLDYEPVQDREETINRDARVTPFGFRPMVKQAFDVKDQSHLRALMKIINRLLDPGWTVELSLDNGATYREVVLSKLNGPTPWRGKTIAGARWEWTLTAVRLIPDLRYHESGTGW